VLRALLGVIAMTTMATADRPHDGVFRASPGLGYAFDGASSCSLAGRMFVGGFAFEYEVVDGLFVGAAATIVFNTLLADGPCGAEDGLRLTLGMIAGPMVEWYPTDGPFQLFAVAGYSEIGEAEGEMRQPGRGIGGTLGIGWDWALGRPDAGRAGFRVQVSGFRTYGGMVDHAALAPAVVATFAFD
jgi:hypothetical protein